MTLKQAQFYEYSQMPVSDTTWSLHAGPDQRIYTASCCEHRGGVSVIVARYNEETDDLDYLFDVGEEGRDPGNSGRATQCKIHYSFAPCQRDGILYAATHASAPAINETHFNINADWGDIRKAFRGSVLIAYDCNRDEVLWARDFIPREGCRCMCYDPERGLIYAAGWPRNHFLVYDLKTQELKSMGRMGSINPQAIWLDAKGRAHTTNDNGRILRYDPDKKRLEELDCWIPRAANVSGWHGIVYDIVAAPDGESMFGVPWRNQPHLFRHWPLEGTHGRMEDLGPATQGAEDRDLQHPISFFQDHVGGFTIGPDNKIYYVKTQWPSKQETELNPWQGEATKVFKGIVVQLDPETNERVDFAEVKRPDEKPSHYVSRGAMNYKGDLFFGNVGGSPSGMFRLDMGNNKIIAPNEHQMRLWG